MSREHHDVDIGKSRERPKQANRLEGLAMNLQPAERLQLVKPSATLSLVAEVGRLRKSGHDIVSLEGGEPDCDTPEHIKLAAISALRAGHTKYTAVDGTTSLKQAIISKFQRENGLKYAPNQIVVSCGAKQAFYNLCQALLDPGHEVIIPAPYWVSYPDIVALAAGTPVIIPTSISQNFKISPRQLAAAITSRTRLIVLNSPSNPTGAVYTTEELQALGEVMRLHPGIMVASDDIYERITLDTRRIDNLATACPDLYERIVIINGVSKAYSMTGWRIGYAAGPQWLMAAMKTIQSQCTSNPTSFAQYAAEAALLEEQDSIDTMNVIYRERHEYLVGALNRIRGIQCIPAIGAFYVFPEISGAIRALQLRTDQEFSQTLLMKALVAVVPGSAFGAEGHIRISFAASMEELKKGVKRIGDFVGWNRGRATL